MELCPLAFFVELPKSSNKGEDGGDCAGWAVNPIGPQGGVEQQLVGSFESCKTNPALSSADLCGLKLWFSDAWQCASMTGIRGLLTPDGLQVLVTALQ
jgi:hypothetical protein